MGWVVRDIVYRWRRQFGRYSASDWTQFAEDIGLSIRRYDLSRVQRKAFIYKRTVVIDQNISEVAQMFVAWHELGHHVCHVGNQEWWARRPCGNLIISKREHQAIEFVMLFPAWDDDALDELYTNGLLELDRLHDDDVHQLRAS